MLTLLVVQVYDTVIEHDAVKTEIYCFNYCLISQFSLHHLWSYNKIEENGFERLKKESSVFYNMYYILKIIYIIVRYKIYNF